MEKIDLIESLRKRGFSLEIIKAFEEVKREEFILPEYRQFAYSDESLPIQGGQFISQPFAIAFMLDLLHLEDKKKILEVGSGSGYALALISRICPNSKIYGIERLKELQELSVDRLKSYGNAMIFHGDGTKGYKTQSPYDRILVSAFGEGVPTELLRQLADGGVMVIPIKDSIYKLTKRDNEITKEEYPGFKFVPLKKGIDRGDRGIWRGYTG
jgi:protein-L-isoaspartate(D-aspartate) O-methyltransferase